MEETWKGVCVCVNKGRRRETQIIKTRKREGREGEERERRGGKEGGEEYFALEGLVPRLRRTKSGQLSPPPVPPKQEVGNN